MVAGSQVRVIDPSLRPWLMRLVGCLNIVLAVIGLFYFIVALIIDRKNIDAFPLDSLLLFLLLSIMSVGLVLATAHVGVCLWRGDDTAISTARKLFCIVFGSLFISLFLAVYNFGRAAADPWFDATRALAPQWYLGYPQAALVASIFFRRRAQR